MNKLLLLAALLAVVWFFNRQPPETPGAYPASPAVQEDHGPAAETVTDLVAEAYANQVSGLQVSGQGTVSRLLEDDRGGVLHWTHHDPQGEHEPGWLRHRGRTYQ